MAHNLGRHISAFVPVPVRHLTYVAGSIVAICFLAFLIAGVGQSVPIPVRPVASYDDAQAAHCSQFVELARSKFGPEWKRRLDPRDTLCARQVQAAWERDWRPREAALQPVIQSKIGPEPMPPRVEPQPAHQRKTIATTAPADQPKAIASTARPPKGVRREVGRAHAKTYSLTAVTDRTRTPPIPRVKRAPRIHSAAVNKRRPRDAALEDGYGGEQAHGAHSFSARDDGDESDATLNSAQLGQSSRYDDEALRPSNDYRDAYENEDRDAYDNYDTDPYGHDDSDYYEDDSDYR